MDTMQLVLCTNLEGRTVSADARDMRTAPRASVCEEAVAWMENAAGRLVEVLRIEGVELFAIVFLPRSEESNMLLAMVI